MSEWVSFRERQECCEKFVVENVSTRETLMKIQRKEYIGKNEGWSVSEKWNKILRNIMKRKYGKKVKWNNGNKDIDAFPQNW